jgi:hypothetical protein
VNEKIFSIADLSNEIGVSRQTIYNKIDELELELKEYVVDTKNVKHYKAEAINIIKNSIKNQPIRKYKTIRNNKDDEYSDLKEIYTSNLLNQIKHLEDQIKEKDKLMEDQLKTKDKQLEEKDKQLNNKDEIIKNFQILLKNEQENNLKLLETKKDSILERIFGKKNKDL